MEVWHVDYLLTCRRDLSDRLWLANQCVQTIHHSFKCQFDHSSEYFFPFSELLPLAHCRGQVHCTWKKKKKKKSKRGCHHIFFRRYVNGRSILSAGKTLISTNKKSYFFQRPTPIISVNPTGYSSVPMRQATTAQPENPAFITSLLCITSPSFITSLPSVTSPLHTSPSFIASLPDQRH